jgi:hypothetical protein
MHCVIMTPKHTCEQYKPCNPQLLLRKLRHGTFSWLGRLLGPGIPLQIAYTTSNLHRVLSAKFLPVMPEEISLPGHWSLLWHLPQTAMQVPTSPGPLSGPLVSLNWSLNNFNEHHYSEIQPISKRCFLWSQMALGLTLF